MMMIMTFCIPFLISLRQSEIRTRNEVTDQIQEMELKLITHHVWCVFSVPSKILHTNHINDTKRPNKKEKRKLK